MRYLARGAATLLLLAGCGDQATESARIDGQVVEDQLVAEVGTSEWVRENSAVSCPASIPDELDYQFECIWHGPRRAETIEVTITTSDPLEMIWWRAL